SPSFGVVITTPNDGLAMAENRAQDAVVKIGTPSCRHPRAKTTIKWIVGILQSTADVSNRCITENWIKDLASQGHALSGVQVVLQIDELATRIDQTDLFAVGL